MRASLLRQQRWGRKKENGSGVDLLNLKTPVQWHCSSNKAIPPNASQFTNWTPNTLCHTLANQGQCIQTAVKLYNTTFIFESIKFYLLYMYLNNVTKSNFIPWASPWSSAYFLRQDSLNLEFIDPARVTAGKPQRAPRIGLQGKLLGPTLM